MFEECLATNPLFTRYMFRRIAVSWVLHLTRCWKGAKTKNRERPRRVSGPEKLGAFQLRDTASVRYPRRRQAINGHLCSLPEGVSLPKARKK